jgi:hypothetical protein
MVGIAAPKMGLATDSWKAAYGATGFQESWPIG